MPSPGHGVGGRGGVAHEQGPPGGERDAVDPGGDGPGPVGPLGLPGVAQHLGQAGPAQQLAPHAGHVAHRERPAPVDAEAHVHRSVGEGERPGVAGQEVGLEPHPQVAAGGGRGAPQVLAEGVALAPVAGHGHAHAAPQRRPHAVGPHHVPGGHLPQALDLGPHHVAVVAGRGQGAAVVDVGAGGAGRIDQGRVELHPAGGGGVGAPAPGEREGGRPTVRRGHHHVVDGLPGRHGGGFDAQLLEQREGAGGEAVAADLVPGEPGLVDDHHVATGAGQRGRRRGPRRSGPDDEDVGPSRHGRVEPAPRPRARPLRAGAATASTSSQAPRRAATRRSGSVTAAGSTLMPMWMSSR